jgi:hypothetical protein
MDGWAMKVFDAMLVVITGAARRREREGGPGHQVRHLVRRRQVGDPRGPGVRAGGMRGQPRPAWRRLHRPLLSDSY